MDMDVRIQIIFQYKEKYTFVLCSRIQNLQWYFSIYHKIIYLSWWNGMSLYITWLFW